MSTLVDIRTFQAVGNPTQQLQSWTTSASSSGYWHAVCAFAKHQLEVKQTLGINTRLQLPKL
jgi:hypothetical protein